MVIRTTSKLQMLVGLVLLVVLGAWWARYLVQHPAYNWDMFMYVGCALAPDYGASSGLQLDSLHAATLSALQAQLPPAEYEMFTTGDYRGNVANDVAFFGEELQKYEVKPLYIGIVRLAYQLGVTVTRATVVPSALGVVALALGLFYWVSCTRKLWVAFIGASLLMVSNPMWYLGAFSTPDLFSAPFLTWACYGVYRRWPAPMVALVGAVAVATRLDNVLAVGLLVLIAGYDQALRAGWSRERAMLVMAGLAVAGVAVMLAVVSALGFAPLDLLGAYAHVYTAEGYLFHLNYSYTQFAWRSSGALVGALALLSFSALNDASRRIVAIVGAVVGIRLLVFPLFEERFFVGFEWAVLAAIGAGIGLKREQSIGLVSTRLRRH